jgi:hypothetical protein
VAAEQMAEALDVTEQPPGPHGGNRDHEHHRPDDQ